MAVCLSTPPQRRYKSPLDRLLALFLKCFSMASPRKEANQLIYTIFLLEIGLYNEDL